MIAHLFYKGECFSLLSVAVGGGGEDRSGDPSSEPTTGSPAAVIQRGPTSPPAPASSPGPTINGLSVRAAEAVAMSVLAGMGSVQPGGGGGVVMATPQSQPGPR